MLLTDLSAMACLAFLLIQPRLTAPGVGTSAVDRALPISMMNQENVSRPEYLLVLALP